MAQPTVNLNCLQYQTIPPGGSAAVPNGAQILYYSENGILTSDCESVQAQIDDVDTSTNCYGINWDVETAGGGGGTGAWPINEVFVSKIGLGGTEYTTNLVLNTPSNRDLLEQEIHNKFPFIDADIESLTVTGERETFRLNLRIPTIFGTDFFIEFSTTGSPGFTPTKFFAVLCSECCDEITT